jgi:hypothetical protein
LSGMPFSSRCLRMYAPKAMGITELRKGLTVRQATAWQSSDQPLTKRAI